jgi:hypothetical protein
MEGGKPKITEEQKKPTIISLNTLSYRIYGDDITKIQQVENGQENSVLNIKLTLQSSANKF